MHIRSHIGYKPFECLYCGRKFTQGGNLRTHLRLHTGEKPFTCNVCNRSFNRKGNLAAHKLTHENLKPYECKLDNCDKSFSQLGNLKLHQNRFHLETLNTLTKQLQIIYHLKIKNCWHISKIYTRILIKEFVEEGKHRRKVNVY